MVSDDELLRRLSELLTHSRRCEADLIAHIGEVDARGLYACRAARSMHVYCTEILHLSDQEAYLRIAVARAAREHSMLLAMLRDGRLHLSGLARLAPHLTCKNRDELLARATHMSYRQIVELVAELEPKPDAPATIRKLPARRAEISATSAPQPGAADGESPASMLRADQEPALDSGLRLDDDAAASVPPATAERAASELCARRAAHPTLPAQPATVQPLAPLRYKVQFTASAELRDKLERLQALMRSSIPDGDLAKIFDVLVTAKLDRLEANRFAKTKKPRKGLAGTDTTPKSRHIPAPIRRAVYERDGGRCTYVDETGRRCTARHRLEFQHDEPFGRGGRHSLQNLSLMCRTHNSLMAERDYGREVMARHRRSASRVSEPVAVNSGKTPSRQPGSAPG